MCHRQHSPLLLPKKMKFRNRKFRFFHSTTILPTFFIIFAIQKQGHGENIHHNLPDNLEIIDPKTLGLSGTDLEEFLGNVKLLPLEGEFGGTGSPKAQILTVGFDGSEKLNLQDFESLSTAGLADADKHVAEMAFKKFQNFFQNPKLAKDVDDIRNDESTGFESSSVFATTTPSSTTVTTGRSNPSNAKQRKRVRIGKRPIFSSTFRSFSDSTPEMSTTQKYYPTELQNYAPTTSPMESSYHKYHHHHLKQHLYPYRSSFTNQLPTTFIQSDFSNSQIQRPISQPTKYQHHQQNIHGNYGVSSSPFTQPSSTLNSINQVMYNVEPFDQSQNTPQQFPQHSKRIVLKQANQNALRASEQQKYPYVAKQPHFKLTRFQQGSRTSPSVKPQGRNPPHVTSHQQNSHFQHEQRLPNNIPISQEIFQTFDQKQNVPVPRSQYQNYNGGINTQLQRHNTYQSIQHIQPTSGQYRQQKQILFPASSSANSQTQIPIHQLEHKQKEIQQKIQLQQVDQRQQHRHQNFQLIQQHRHKNLKNNDNQIRQNFNPSQLDPLQPPQKMEMNHAAVPSQRIQILRTPKDVQWNNYPQHEQYRHVQLPSGLPQQQHHFIGISQSTPKSVSMSGIFQITPSTPLVTISTVENAMTAHKTIMQQRLEMNMITKQRELTNNQIPGSSQPFFHTPDSKYHFQVESQKQSPPVQFQHESGPPQQQHHQPFPQLQKSPPPKEFRIQGQQSPNLGTPLLPNPRFPPPSPLPLTKHFRQDPIPAQGHPPPPMFFSDPFRYIHTPPPPPPPPEFRDSSHSRPKNQVPPPLGFDNFIDQRFPMMKLQRIPYVIDNESRSRPPHGASMIRAMPATNFNHHFPSQMQGEAHHQHYHQQPQLQLHLAPPTPYETSPRFPTTLAAQEDANLHNEANDYTRNLGLNIQSINSAPLISSFIA